MIVEYLLGRVQQQEQLRVPHGVVHILSIFSGREDVAVPENGQLLREITLLNIQARAQVVDPDFAPPEFIEYSDPQRVGKRLEELRLERADLTHVYSYIFIFSVHSQLGLLVFGLLGLD